MWHNAASEDGERAPRDRWPVLRSGSLLAWAGQLTNISSKWTRRGPVVAYAIRRRRNALLMPSPCTLALIAGIHPL